MSSRDDRRRRLLSKDERVLWNSFTRAIAPLRPEADAALESGETPPELAAPAPSRRSVAMPASEPAKPPPSLAPLGRRLRQRVARGREAIDGRLDLHGLTQAQAHSALLHFLRDASAREARLVLIITGKGSRNLGGRGEAERGVLRRQVPHWLSLPEFRSFVIGYEDAHIAHGGEGALYVRIRRGRSR
jgi:DNA-nicking Smr family endonuclease